jgi:DNA-binding transcriptional MocR family regulator
MSPGLRIGWIVAGKPLIRRLVLVKQASDLNSANVNQMVMHKLVEATYERQVTAARAHYRRRRDAMLAALARYMPAGVTWTNPQGGLFVWVRLPDGHDGAACCSAPLRKLAWRSCRAAPSSSTAAAATPCGSAIRCPTRRPSARASGDWPA